MGRAVLALSAGEPTSAGHEVQRGVDTPNIVRIAGDHSRLIGVERRDTNHSGAKQASDTCLRATAAPRLRNHACRSVHYTAIRDREFDERADSAVVPLEPDQRARIEALQAERAPRPSFLLSRGGTVLGPHLRQQRNEVFSARLLLHG